MDGVIGDLMGSYTWAGLSAAVVLAVVVQVLKGVFKLEGRAVVILVIALALLLGLGAQAAQVWPAWGPWYEQIVWSLFVGAAAAGGYVVQDRLRKPDRPRLGADAPDADG